MFVNGQGKRILANTVVDVLSGSVFPTSIDFGVFLVSEYAGISGMAKVDSSQNNIARLRFDYRSDSETTIISSDVGVASGGIIVNELNPAMYANISVRQINSATPVRVYLTGLPIR